MPQQFRTNIVEGIQTPEDPAVSMNRALTLRSLIEQRKQMAELRTQQAAESRIKQQQEQFNLDAARRGQALQDSTQGVYAAGGTDDEIRANLLKVNAPAAFKMDTDSRANKTTDLANQEKQIKIHGEQIGQLASASGALLNLPPEARPAAWPEFRAGLLASKLATEQDLPAQYPGDQWMHQQHDKGLTAKDQLEQEGKAADEARKKALAGPELATKTAESTMKTADAAQFAQPVLDAAGQAVLGADGKPTTQGMTNKERQQLDLRAAEIRKQNTPAELAFAATDKTKSPEDRQQATDALALLVQQANASRPVTNVTMGAGGVSATAQMMAEGKMSPATARAILRKNPQVLAEVRSIDPNFDEATIEQRYGTLKEFNNTSNTKAGGQALALNTLIHHADLYMQAGEALKNGTFKPGNAAYNAVASAFGSAPPQNAALVARFFAGETGKVATGGVPAEGEINGILKTLGSDNSPEQIRGAGQKLLEIAAGRATPLMERVKESKLDSVVHVMGPDAKEILGRRGFDPETMKFRRPAGGGTAGVISVTDPNGGVHNFKDQAAADRFKKAAGIK